MSTLRYNGPVCFGELEELEKIKLQDGYATPDSYIYENDNGKFQIIKIEKVGMFEDTSGRRGEKYPAAMIRDQYGNSKALKISKSLFTNRNNCQEAVEEWHLEQTIPKSILTVSIPTENLNRFYRAMTAAGISDRTTAVLESLELYQNKYLKDVK